jgi:hypothetical protein
MVEGQTRVEKEGEALRLLALEIRPQKAGFAVFEGATLLDWGVRDYGPTPAFRRIGTLLSLYAPSVIVIRRRHYLKHGDTVARVVQSIKRGAQRKSISVQSLDAHRIRAFFKQQGCESKHAASTLLAEWFPELAWKLPPERKPWQPEPHNTLLFDAVAIAVTFLIAQS